MRIIRRIAAWFTGKRRREKVIVCNEILSKNVRKAETSAWEWLYGRQ